MHVFIYVYEITGSKHVRFYEKKFNVDFRQIFLLLILFLPNQMTKLRLLSFLLYSDSKLRKNKIAHENKRSLVNTVTSRFGFGKVRRESASASPTCFWNF